MRILSFLLGNILWIGSNNVVVSIVAAQGYVYNANIKSSIRTPQPYEYIRDEELPKSYDPYLFLLCD